MDKIKVENLDLYYGNFQALKNINLGMQQNEITAFIGPSGCGKSTLLKSSQQDERPYRRMQDHRPSYSGRRRYLRQYGYKSSA